MLPQKQKCLALNSLGLYCGCQALSNGRCRGHTPVLFTAAPAPAPARRSVSHHARTTLASFSAWRDLFGPGFGRTMRDTPMAFNL